ncbi:hypothetical protein SRB5_70560 [Streptomyces sp. RB5]|uniref:Uncharacterized protein n=1 Tax=Streptomyces smaragdinus TaxID=2585196 RepID=A0A7K0CU16_9ACTN|nr:hypothetical protein [Streptomyces smaragdinus]MQY16853.1 hypothetical protein [Streptomyces smaragdinus]
MTRPTHRPAAALRRLADLTDFGWDRVHAFGEGATAEEVEKVAGEPVLDDNRYYDQGNLLVFEEDGEVVKAVTLVPGPLTYDRTTWDADTVVEPATDRRPTVLKLADGS